MTSLIIGQPIIIKAVVTLFLISSLNAANNVNHNTDLKTKITSAVTCDLKSCGGRLGDQLILYLKAKMFAHKYNLPFLYKPFPYSDQLVMHDKEEHFKESDSMQFQRVVEPQYEKQEIAQDNGTLYVINYYGDLNSMYGVNVWRGIRNKALQKEIAQMISPRLPLEDIFCPDNQVSVALHVRRGGGYDQTSFGDEIKTPSSDHLPVHTTPVHTTPVYTTIDKLYPLKFPPVQYYIDQLKALSALFENKPLYVHIFTDDKNTQKLLEFFQEKFKKFPITFATRTSGNAHNANVLEDLFGMTKFDCLIRPFSGLSIIASEIGNHKIVVVPRSSHWEDNTLVIDWTDVYKAADWKVLLKK